MSGISGAIAADSAADASEYAADLQYEATMKGLEVQERMFQQQQTMMQPMVDAELMRHKFTRGGERAFKDVYSKGPGEFKESGYYKDAQANIDLAISDSANALAKSGAASGQGGALTKQMGRYAAPYAAQQLAGQRANWLNEWQATKLNPAMQWASLGSNPYVGNSAAAGQNAISAGWLVARHRLAVHLVVPQQCSRACRTQAHRFSKASVRSPVRRLMIYGNRRKICLRKCCITDTLCLGRDRPISAMRLPEG